MSDVYDARTYEDILRDGYPQYGELEKGRLDRRKRDEDLQRGAGLYGGCVPL